MKKAYHIKLYSLCDRSFFALGGKKGMILIKEQWENIKIYGIID